MKWKKPCNETIINFLESKSWLLDDSHELFYALKPPAEFQFENPAFRLRIPKDDRFFDGEYAYQIVNSIAEMYNSKLQRMIDLFSKKRAESQSEAYVI